jgi:hypothetical protein
LLLDKNKITVLIVIEEKVFCPKTMFGTNILKDELFSFDTVILELSFQYIFAFILVGGTQFIFLIIHEHSIFALCD